MGQDPIFPSRPLRDRCILPFVGDKRTATPFTHRIVRVRGGEGMIVNFAERAHNHNFELDPIVRSLLDTDFYKLLMLQFIWKHFRGVRVSFGLHNRNVKFQLAKMIAREEIVAQLDHVRKLKYRKSELIWLAGKTFYGA